MDNNKVTFLFEGKDAEAVAQYFFTWFVDGGLEDYIVDRLAKEMGMDIESTSCSSEDKTITITSK